MRRGKEIAQGSHASMAFLLNKLKLENGDSGTLASAKLSEEEVEWINGNFAKICLQVNSEDELVELHKRAKNLGLTSNIITDSGYTEFRGRPTITALAIGPHESSKIDIVTKELRLY